MISLSKSCNLDLILDVSRNGCMYHAVVYQLPTLEHWQDPNVAVITLN